jgi:hypothetical protein
MSYVHIQAERIKTQTKKYIERINEHNHLFKVNGIHVSPELAQFCAEICKVNRHVKFGVGNGLHYTQHYYDELYVYMDGHTYAMGKVGFSNYLLRGNNTPKYMVYARMICNDKFNEDREQHHMATAESIERAIKNVKKYMRPYSPAESAGITFMDIRQKFSSVIRGVSSNLTGVEYDIKHSNHLRAELFHMIDVGYEFLAEDFKDMIVKWREAYLADKESKSRALDVYYVGVRIHRDEMLCDVIEVLDASNRYHDFDRFAPVTTYKMEELPEHIGGSLATLSMVDDNHYVDGVGLRVDSSTFWVQK